MSFQKAADLLRLAEMASSRYSGVGLQEIADEFACDHRTAQRMTRALEDCFPNVETLVDEARRKFWRLKGGDVQLMKAQGIRDSELAAIEIAIRRASHDGATNEVAALKSLRDRLKAAMPRPHARRAEADAEAVLEAYGFASRPGPRVRADPLVLSTIAEALKGPLLVSITYAGGSGEAGRTRLLEPYGLLLGARRYLVAREQGGRGQIQHFRLDRITSARLEAQSFRRDPDFSLDDHAASAFGSFHDAEEFAETIWRFSAAAAPVAREFTFHPRQELTENDDGSLTVRFAASGHLEMAWHLYAWGDQVEVLAPERLRGMVMAHRRGDFPALP